MPLLHLSLAYGLGIGIAWLTLFLLPVECAFPAWLWLLPLAALPFAPLANRLQREPNTPLRWGREYGFRMPRGAVTPALIVACALALGMGALRYWGDPLYPCLSERDLAYYNVPANDSFNVKQGWRIIDGSIASHIAQSPNRQRVTIAAHTMQHFGDALPISGKVTLLLDADSGLRYGDRVRVAGVLSEPPEFADFSWRDYLARHDIRSTMNLAQIEPLAGDPTGNPLLRTIYSLRARGESVLNALLPEPHAALAAGMLLGIDANIPDALMEQFNDTSTSHVIVISGSNIALIAGVLMALGARLGKRNRWVIGATLAGIALYAVLVGAEASVVRAAIMGGLLVIATALNRRSAAIVSLAFAAFIMALHNPHILWEIGFQLSAIATLGLILLLPALRPHAAASENLASAINPFRSATAFLLDTVAVSLAATIAVTPLLIWHFHRLSLVGLLTNLLIVPIQPLILITGLAGVVVGILGVLPLAGIILAPTWLGLLWTVTLVQWTAQLRWANIAVAGPAAAVVIALCVALCLLLYTAAASRKRAIHPMTAEAAQPRLAPKWQRLATSRLATGALLILAALAWLGIAARPDGMAHLWILPTERGMAVLAQSPTGRQFLIDGGDDGARLLSTLGGVMGLWDRRIDRMILTTSDARTLTTQTTVANRLQIDAALTTLPLQAEISTWARRLETSSIPTQGIASGSRIEASDNLHLTLRAADDEHGIVEIAYGNFRALLAPSTDIDPALLAGEVTLLILADDGRADAAATLAQATPAYIALYGDDTLTTTAQILYPNVTGLIHLRTDGESLWLTP